MRARFLTTRDDSFELLLKPIIDTCAVNEPRATNGSTAFVVEKLAEGVHSPRNPQ